MSFRIEFSEETERLLEHTAKVCDITVEEILREALILWCRSRTGYGWGWGSRHYDPPPCLETGGDEPSEGTVSAQVLPSDDLSDQLAESLREVREGTGTRRKAHF